MRLDQTAKQESEDCCRDECDYEIAIERYVDSEKARAIFPHHREHRAGLNHEIEDRPALIRGAEQIRGEDKVTGTRHRQELGKSLDDAENERIDQVANAAASLKERNRVCPYFLMKAAILDQ